MKLEKSNRSQSTSGLFKQRPLSLVFSRKSAAPAAGTTTSSLTVSSRLVRVTSQDSIGNCSLNVNNLDNDADSDRMSRLSPSRCELKSVSIETGSRFQGVFGNGNSVNGIELVDCEPSRRRRIGSVEILDSRHFVGSNNFSNPPGLKPSYVHLACAVSGYSDLNRYNSKLREGFRSRDSSPVKIAWLRSSGGTSENHYSPLERLKSPNLLTSKPTSPRSPQDLSGLRSPLKVLEIQQQQEKLLQGGYGASTFGQGRSVSVDRARFFGSTTTPVCTSMGRGRDLAFASPSAPCCQRGNRDVSSVPTENDCLDTSRERPSRSSRRANGYDLKPAGSPLPDRGSRCTSRSPVDAENKEYAEAISTGKSFIQQRIERLYGQSRRRSDAEDDVDAAAAMKKQGRIGSNGKVEQAPGTPPVFRHLRQEFREQLVGGIGVGSGLRVRRSEPVTGTGSTPTAVSTSSIILCKPEPSTLTQNNIVGKDNKHLVGVVSSKPSFAAEDQGTTSTLNSPTASFSESTSALVNVHGRTTSQFSTLTVETAPFTGDESPTALNPADIDCNTDDLTSAGTDEVLTMEDSSVSISVTEEVAEEFDASGRSEVAADSVDKTISSDATESASTSSVKNGLYYYKVMNDECARLTALIIQAEKEVESGTLPDETCGVLRAASGKARLLLDQKFAQFKSLCDRNLTPGGEGETLVTDEDLAGFWDLVCIQVDQVNEIFKDIESMRNNDWKLPDAPATVSKKSVKRPSGSTRKKLSESPAGSGAGSKTPAASSASRKSDERRMQLLEAKRRMKREMEQKSVQNEVGGV